MATTLSNGLGQPSEPSWGKEANAAPVWFGEWGGWPQIHRFEYLWISYPWGFQEQDPCNNEGQLQGGELKKKETES